MPQLLFPWERNQVPTEQEAGLAPEQAWTFQRKRKTLAPVGTRTLDHPAQRSHYTTYSGSSFFSRYFSYFSTKNENLLDICTVQAVKSESKALQHISVEFLSTLISRYLANSIYTHTHTHTHMMEEEN